MNPREQGSRGAWRTCRQLGIDLRDAAAVGDTP